MAVAAPLYTRFLVFRWNEGQDRVVVDLRQARFFDGVERRVAMTVPRRLLLGARDRLVLVVIQSCAEIKFQASIVRHRRDVVPVAISTQVQAEVTSGGHVRGGGTAGARLRAVLQGIEAALAAVVPVIVACVEINQ